MSLRDGTKKMSKSDVSDYSRIHLLDDADTITLKIRKAKTDSDPIPSSKEGLQNRPEAENLMGIYSALSAENIDALCSEYSGQPFSSFKNALTEILIESLRPIREKMQHLLQHPDELDKVLYDGADIANLLAEKHIKEIREVLGMIPRR